LDKTATAFFLPLSRWEVGMKSIDFLEILKLGLPGLVFLLSLLSCWLLAREQKRPEVREAVLKTIQKYIYINAAFVMLTVATPMAESKMPDTTSQEFTVKATTQPEIKKGFAVVCRGANYAERYLLIKNPKHLGQLIQVHAKSVMPCSGELIIAISPEDARYLGWDAGISSDNVAVAAAIQSGTKFVM
jgi:hypothetical protein